MRMLILTQYFAPEIGAAQTRLLEFGRALRRREWDVDVVTAMPSYPTGQIFKGYRGSLFNRETVEGMHVTRFWAYATKDVSLPKRMAAYGTFCVTSLLSLFCVRRPNVIFVESPPLVLPVTAFLLSRAWRCPWVVNISDLWPDSVIQLGLASQHGLGAKAAYNLERFVYTHASAVTAVTEGIRDVLLGEKRIPGEKVLFLPNGVNVDMFALKAIDSRAPKKAFVYAGLIGSAQGVSIILRVAAKLRHRSDIVFRIVGDGPERAKIDSQLRKEGFRNVLLQPPIPLADMPRLLEQSYAFLVTLRRIPLFEGARPSKMMPPLAAGVPIIYSGTGEGARLVARSGAGIVVAPEDADELAGAVEWLADHPDEARVMGERGRAYAVEHCSWDKLVAEWLEQLEAAIPVLSRTGAADCCVTRR